MMLIVTGAAIKWVISFFHILNIIAEFYYTISIKIWKEGKDAG